MKRAMILNLLADELEAIADPEYKPLPGSVGVAIGSMVRDVLTLEHRTDEELHNASVCAVERQAGRYRRIYRQKGATK